MGMDEEFIALFCAVMNTYRYGRYHMMIQLCLYHVLYDSITQHSQHIAQQPI